MARNVSAAMVQRCATSVALPAQNAWKIDRADASRRLPEINMHGVFRADDELQVDIKQTINRWYVIVVRSGKELHVYTFLRIRQMKPYWPRYQEGVKLARHRAGVRWRGVIPGYLFIPVPMDKTIDCPLIEKAPGVLKVIRKAEHKLAELSVEEIRNIREIEDALNASPIAAVQGIPFKVGQEDKRKSGLGRPDRADRKQAADCGRDLNVRPPDLPNGISQQARSGDTRRRVRLRHGHRIIDRPPRDGIAHHQTSSGDSSTRCARPPIYGGLNE
jgi:transcription antitermination factor NusG